MKRLFNYLKFLVSLSLICSLTLPSYATLSNSDGSAFVTKSEFDSALADFNSRLSTFEAGINSKIDSQVTSYLDRNGIWSGVEQVLTQDAYRGKLTYMDNWCVRNGTKTQTSAYVCTGGNSSSYRVKIGENTAWMFDGNYGVRDGEPFLAIENVTKSGMLFGNIDIGSWVGSQVNSGNPSTNFRHQDQYFGKFLKECVNWTDQHQAKQLSCYNSSNGYSYLYNITVAWMYGYQIDMTSTMYVEISNDNFANVLWQGTAYDLNMQHYYGDASNLNAFGGGHYYDGIQVPAAPRQYLVTAFVTKGQSIKARWRWKILGNCFHLSTNQAAMLLFKPPTENGGDAQPLDKEYFAQIIQLTNFKVY